jgi:hypothetical protein
LEFLVWLQYRLNRYLSPSYSLENELARLINWQNWVLMLCLDKNVDLAYEAAYTLCCCEAEGHEAVIAVVNSSPFAFQILSSAKQSHSEKEVK